MTLAEILIIVVATLIVLFIGIVLGVFGMALVFANYAQKHNINLFST